MFPNRRGNQSYGEPPPLLARVRVKSSAFPLEFIACEFRKQTRIYSRFSPVCANVPQGPEVEGDIWPALYMVQVPSIAGPMLSANRS